MIPITVHREQLLLTESFPTYVPLLEKHDLGKLYAHSQSLLISHCRRRRR